MGPFRRIPRFFLVIALLATAGPGRADGLRGATYNSGGFGTPGSTGWNALVAVLRRVDADVVALQEIHGSADLDHLDDLAEAAGYPFHAASEVSGTLSGNLRNGVLSRFPVARTESWSAAELSGDPGANDITRDMFVAWISVDPGLHPWAFLVVHLKAGTSDTDRFRRQVEVRRVVQALDRIREETPGAPIVLLGDFNEDPRNGPFGSPVFEELPPGLPATYRLGNDIEFPVVYDPFATLEDAGMFLLDAAHEDDPDDPVTHPPTLRRLDLLWLEEHGATTGTEVYDACDDNGVDDPPPGDRLPKAGDPLPCGTSANASDHLDVFGDFARAAVDADGDGVDDGADCAPRDPGEGTPGEVGGVRGGRAGGAVARFTWDPVPTADRYDVARGRLGDAGDGQCATDEDPDPTDTVFEDPAVPPPAAGWHYLFRGVDDGCGGPGPWGSAAAGEGCP